MVSGGEARFQAILNSMMDPYVLLQAVRDDDGTFVDFEFADANDAACAYYRVPKDNLVGRRLLDVMPPEADGGLRAAYVRVVKTGEPLVLDNHEYRFGALGEPRWFDIRGVNVGDAISYTWRDVTERHQHAQRLAESEERYRLLAENSTDVVLRVRGNDIVWASSSLTRTLGWVQVDWVGHSLAEFGHPDDMPQVLRASRQMDAGDVAVFRVRLKDADGNWRWVEAHAQTFKDADGQPDGYLASFRVVDREVEAERLLERRATYDDLTGALKREVALARLQDLGQGARVPGTETGVVFVDVDSFKDVNDTHGHAAGDLLLRVFAGRIRECVRGGDTIARMGGDEFLVILTGLHDLDEATAVAEKIRLACADPVPTRDGSISASVSIGVTLSKAMESVDEVVARADHAMYRAKADGRNQVITVPR